MTEARAELPPGYSLDYGDPDRVTVLNERGYPVAVCTPEDPTEVVVQLAWYQYNRGWAERFAVRRWIGGGESVTA